MTEQTTGWARMSLLALAKMAGDPEPPPPPPPEPRWVRSHEAPACMLCGKKFTMLLCPKHHCRSCGKAACGDCSTNSMFLNRWLHDVKPHALREGRSPEKLRVCDGCWQTAGVRADRWPAEGQNPGEGSVDGMDVRLGMEIRCTDGDGHPMYAGSEAAAAEWMNALHELGVSAITVRRFRPLVNAMLIFEYIAEVEVRASGWYQLTDATGDKYMIRCLLAGVHSVRYNSDNPAITRVTRCPVGLSSTPKFELGHAIDHITSLASSARPLQQQPAGAEKQQQQLGDEPAPEEAVSLEGYPTAGEYCRWGLSAKGARHIHELFDVPEGTTTAAVCHTFIKTRTTPTGWEHRPRPSSEGGRQRYVHEYLETVTGQVQSAAPPETCSLCELLSTEPATAALTGRPSAFLSHAWKYSFGNLVDAMEAFQAAQLEGKPEIFFWIDVCSIDQHKVGGWPQEWWITNFKEAIRLIGHTVMMLSPWDSPVPLTRAWCLWELHCTVSVGAEFSVCLGPDEQAALEVALLSNSGAWLDAFASIDVAKAEAGKDKDREMILRVVRATAGGTSALNALAMAEIRKWVRGVVTGMVAARRTENGSLDPAHLDDARLLARVLNKMAAVGEEADGRQLLAEVVDTYAEHSGAGHADTIQANMDLASVLVDTGKINEARQLYVDKLVPAVTAEYGSGHPFTLSVKHKLAMLLDDSPQTENLSEALRLYVEVVTGYTSHFGAQDTVTLGAKNNLANLLKNLDELHEAQRLLEEEVLPGFTAEYGGGHSKTLSVKINLANILTSLGDDSAARRFFEEAVAGFKEQYGDRHVLTVEAKLMLGTLLQKSAMLEARRLYEEVLAIQTPELSVGEIGFQFAHAKHNLATILMEEAGEEMQAQQLFKEVIAESESAKQPGPAKLRARPHPALERTMSCTMDRFNVSTSSKLNLALMFRATGDLPGARQLNEEVVAVQTEQLGSGHVDTLKTKQNLAMVLEDMGELSDARRLYYEAVAGLTEQLGDAHKTTLVAKENLSTLLGNAGEVHGAKGLLEEVVAGYTERYGAEHRSTLSRKKNLALLLAHPDSNPNATPAELAEARRLIEEVVVGRTKSLGAAHPKTRDMVKLLAAINAAAGTEAPNRGVHGFVNRWLSR